MSFWNVLEVHPHKPHPLHHSPFSPVHILVRWQVLNGRHKNHIALGGTSYAGGEGVGWVQHRAIVEYKYIHQSCHRPEVHQGWENWVVVEDLVWVRKTGMEGHDTTSNGPCEPLGFDYYQLTESYSQQGHIYPKLYRGPSTAMPTFWFVLASQLEYIARHSHQ